MENEDLIRHDERLSSLESGMKSLTGKIDKVLNLLTQLQIELEASKVKLAIYSGLIALIMGAMVSGVVAMVLK